MNGRLEDEILKVFRRTNGSVSPNTIRAFTNATPRDISEKLALMKKRGDISYVGPQTVPFYRLSKVNRIP